MSAHTPGPWEVSSKLPGHVFRVAHSRLIANCYGYQNNADPNVLSESDANARLIAAAPELLEALEAVVTESEQTADYLTNHVYRKMVKQARAAIAKAKGE